MSRWGKLVYGTGGKLCYGTDGKLVYCTGAKLINPTGFLVTGSGGNANKSTSWDNTLNGVDGLFVRSWGSGYGTSYGYMTYVPPTEYVPAKWYGYAAAGLLRYPVQSDLIGESVSTVQIDLTSAQLTTGQNVTISMRTNSSSTVNSLSSESASPVWSGTSSGTLSISFSATLSNYFFICIAFDPWTEPAGSGLSYKYSAAIDSATVIVRQ